MSHIKIIELVEAVRSQLNYNSVLLNMFRVLSTTNNRSTSNVSTASVTSNTTVQLPSSNVADFEIGHVGGR